jgi:hypothetical protein
MWPQPRAGHLTHICLQSLCCIPHASGPLHKLHVLHQVSTGQQNKQTRTCPEGRGPAKCCMVPQAQARAPVAGQRHS